MKEKILLAELPARSSLKERVTALQRILEQADLQRFIQPRDKVAIKTHFGDVDNDTHIAPELIRPVADLVKKIGGLPFLTETSTLYSGPRQNAITHIELAYEHGFTFERTGVPIIMCDGLLGNAELEVSIPGQLYRKVNIARDAVLADALILLSHPTGHMVTGLGACLKNLGMGLSSRKGKMLQHSSIKPEINRDKCTFCGQCLIWCPEKAIIEQESKAFIVSNQCIGCGECLAVCKFNAVKYNFQVQSADIQQRMAEYALG
ncbi:MAG: DUF362 domain-containing protein, partial [Candidatus Cloacimonetes bacterium]|nr:DUF362 domain-containing protein [Candidatus Cloacimonadota bacterium]